ncbi:MAG TPA: methyltransferase domain-containing protein [Acidimicrobiales bacterium]|nr:methyltransferase domain-containing protein [Acidimicrobiales bacterium]
MDVHEVARLGFGREAEAYERSRPSYPPDAVAWLSEHLALGPGATVVDLAAGTGKLTALLVPTAARLVAVEPLEEMQRVLRRVVPGVPVVAGTAEALPFRAASLDAVCVAQAFHWFDADRAFAELARVLRPGGRVGIVWNARDRSVDWVDRVWAIMDRVERTAPWRDHENWRDSALGGRPGFGLLHQATFGHEHRTTPDGVVDRIKGVSHVAVLPPEEQREVLDEVRAVLAGHPQTRGRAELEIPYRVDCYWTERR